METKTLHRLVCQDSRRPVDLAPESIDLMVTSPPYPMIQMWDDLFAGLNPDIGVRLKKGSGGQAFERMHAELDRVWQQAAGLLKPGALACINVGDAVRTVDGQFGLYANHARIHACLRQLGFTPLPVILWRKPTNAPTKFMGSGMYPPGAYVTLEHEYILVFRKGAPRSFQRQADVLNRRQSAYFWEERNTWFSDVWFNLPGTVQGLGRNHSRARSAAFPFEIPYRLISMFSVKGDTVLDPFAGTGTTLAAAAVAGRNSIGLELDSTFEAVVHQTLSAAAASGRRVVSDRLGRHLAFVNDRLQAGHTFKHANRHYGFAVMTRQEQDLLLDVPLACRPAENDSLRIDYDPNPVISADQMTSAAAGPTAGASLRQGHAGPGPERNRGQRGLWDE